MTYQNDVKLFMRLGGQEYADKLTVHQFTGWNTVVYDLLEACDSAELLAAEHPGPASLSIRLLVEEVHETLAAIIGEDIKEIADGLVDIVYIVMGIANRYGIDFDACWREVQNANIAKVADGVELDSAGKIQKPAGWVGPDIAGALGIK